MPRRVASGLFARVSAGALVVALAATFASAQPLTRPAGLRPAFEDTDETLRLERTAPAKRRPDSTRPGELPTFNASGQQRTFGNPSGSGAGKTGFNSTNTWRRLGSVRSGSARRDTPTPGTLPAPLSLTAPGSSTSAASLSKTPGASAQPAAATSAAAKLAATTPVTSVPARVRLLRIPDGVAATGGTTGSVSAAGTAGTVTNTSLTPAAFTLLRKRTTVEEDPYAPTGVHAGAFLVLPAIELTGGYDTNPARTPTGRSSTLLTVSPELIARSDWQRHEVTATLRGSYTTYGQKPELDRPAFDGKLAGRLDVTRNTALIGEGAFVVGTDNPGSPNVQAGLTRFPIYTTLGGTFGLIQRFNRVEVAVKGTAERTEYQDSTFTDGTTGNNADRDFNRYGATLRASYDLMPGLRPFAEVSADTREHDLAVDRFGLQRDSVGWAAKGGTTFEFSRKLTGEIALGYVQREYKDPTLPQLNGFTFDASLMYALSALTNVKLLATTVAAETTVPGTAGVLTRNAGVEVEHQFRRWLVGTVKFNYGFDDYVGSARKDDRYSVSGALIYKLNRDMQIKGEVREEWMRSSVTGVDYAATVFLLGMRLQR